MSTFTGGKLKLKGNSSLQPAGGVKKKKKKKKDKEDKEDTEKQLQALADQAQDKKAILEGYAIEQKEDEDRRTDAEKRYAERMKKMEAAQLEKQARKSFRERIKDFNENLGQLTEHYDIPKVGPG